MIQDPEEIKQELKTKRKAQLIEGLTEARNMLIAVSTSAPRNVQILALTKLREKVKELAAPTFKLEKDSKKSISNLYNKLDSLIGGLRTLDYSSSDVVALKAKATTRLREIIELSGKEIKIGPMGTSPIWRRYDSEKQNLPEEQEKDKKYYDKRIDSEKQLERLVEGVPLLLKKFSKNEKELSILIAKQYIFARVPIIPLTVPPLLPDELKKFGFKVQSLGGYTVMENQLVLGFNHNFLKQMQEDPDLKNKAKPYQLAEMIVAQLNKESGKNYKILGDDKKPSHGHKTGTYYWLVPARLINLMIQSTGTKLSDKQGGGMSKPQRLTVKQWGFAFQKNWNRG